MSHAEVTGAGRAPSAPRGPSVPGAAGPRPAAGAPVERLMRYAAFGMVLAIFAGFAVTTRGFLSPFNLINVVEQSAILGVLALGMAVVIVAGGSDVQTGGIDLSLAANMGLCAAVLAVSLAAGWSQGAALAATFATGTFVGLVNGLAVTRLGILPLLATLAMTNIVAGLELTLTENTVIGASSPVLSLLANGHAFGLSALVLVLIAVAGATALVLHLTPLGLRLYAAGGAPVAARAAGVRVGRLVWGSYVFAGFTAALGATLSVSRLSASSTGTGEILLSILAAALLGTVFSRRGVPSVGGTLVAVLFIGVLTNGFQLLGLSSNWVSGVQGALILAVVTATTLTRRKAH